MKISRVSDKERAYVAEVLDTEFRASSVGSMTARLERAFAAHMGLARAVTLVNGTATLHAALAAAGIGPGDDVLVPPLTMSATTFAVLQAGARPVFADVDPETFNMDPASLAERLTPACKAAIPVALYGLSPDMERIMALAREHGLFVLEDDAQAMGATCKGRPAGSLAHAASFSLQSSKHLTAGEGGIVATDDIDLADRLRTFANLGYAGLSSRADQAKTDKKKLLNPDYDRHIAMGYNYRMPELCAAVALAQVERLDELVAARRESAALLARAVEPYGWLTPQAVPGDCGHSYWCFTLLLDEKGPSWREFADEFARLGGDPLYAAWKLTYLEPFFSRALNLGPGLCPVAESLQPRLLQFKTNYFDTSEAERQAEILSQTARTLDG